MLITFTLLFFRQALSNAQKGGYISTSTNEAYGIIKLGEQDDHVYEVIDVSEGAHPSLIDGTNKTPPPRRLLPNIHPTVAPPTGGNVGVARGREQEVVYATISGDMTFNID